MVSIEGTIVLHAPKTVGHLLGLCSIILVSYNVLSLTISLLRAESKLWLKTPPPSPLPPLT